MKNISDDIKNISSQILNVQDERNFFRIGVYDRRRNKRIQINNSLELYNYLYMYIRNEIFDNTIKEELRRRREVKGEIDEPIKSDLIYKFDNNGDFLGMKRSHQKKN
ncbi:MAG TPA: hypothetical protein VFK40_05420 [Nitrososphaeraceae archaeon]|nr:hypothetical protein [Nitrososphaeraceae archaeon]